MTTRDEPTGCLQSNAEKEVRKCNLSKGKKCAPPAPSTAPSPAPSTAPSPALALAPSPSTAPSPALAVAPSTAPALAPSPLAPPAPPASPASPAPLVVYERERLSKNADRPLILLDLDNTLICAEELSESSDDQRVEKMEKARNMFRTVRMEDYYDIFERPHVQEFLDYLFKHFSVGIWTASSKDYAIFVVKNFILLPNRPLRKLELFLCSHHCNVSKKYFKGVAKDLKLLSDRWGLKDLADVFLVDDLEHLAKHQPHNVIHVKPFFYDSNNDRELLDVIPRIHAQVFKSTL